MGQSCRGGVLSCMDCGSTNTLEILSEPSKKFDMLSGNQIFKNESRDPIENCIEKLDKPLEIYEKKLSTKAKTLTKKRKSINLDESFKVNYSPRLRVVSSNFCDGSFNLIDKIDRTAETDKSCSSVFYSNQSKQ
ncbi:hypothetical protein SteCoe_19550 [Stentor coeruleus]|uniref:Uncharacterized protein n=1 Tax=Stentor coeruleus TaxID=5963 RepID=A0A1R2BUG7_9CILI|nr:hypothetical protein SteCoe_19550 [Stentor coeruleus]